MAYAGRTTDHTDVTDMILIAAIIRVIRGFISLESLRLGDALETDRNRAIPVGGWPGGMARQKFQHRPAGPVQVGQRF